MKTQCRLMLMFAIGKCPIIDFQLIMSRLGLIEQRLLNTSTREPGYSLRRGVFGAEVGCSIVVVIGEKVTYAN